MTDEGLLAGRYRLLDELGAGGMGTVWRALDVLTEREVALKRLRTEYAKDAKLRRRLRREARAVARLEHANIVRLYDMGETDDGSPFLAMEMVRGEPLSTLKKRGIAFGQLIEFVDQILAALAFAHARGVIHRDLKPDNIVVTTNDANNELVKLLDFGFARVEDDSDDQITQIAKDVFGTPTYMAPEQATGDHDVSPATDLYALGVVLWELLTGKPPYTGRSGTAIVVQHVTKPLPPFEPLSRYPVPAGMQALLNRALEKEPTRRFGSAGEMRRALSALFDDDDEGQTIVSMAPGFQKVSTDTRFVGTETATDEPTSIDQANSDVVGAPAPQNPEELPLVGREPLLRWLWDQVALVCRDSQARSVLLEGAVGVGKSRCCAWLRQSLSEGGWMTPTGAVYRPGEPSRGGFRAVLQGALGLTGRPATRTERLRQVMAEIDPEGRVPSDALAAYLWPEGPPPPVGRVVAMVDGVVRLAAARRPLFIWLDDLQHAAPAELSVLEQLLVNLQVRPAPVLLLGTRRTHGTALTMMGVNEPDRLTHLLERRHELIHLRRVEALDEPAMTALVRQSLPVHPEVARRVVEAARGIPLYAVQAVRYLYEVGALRFADAAYDFSPQAPRLPGSLNALMCSRLGVALEGEGEGLRGLVERLALLGEQFSFGLAEAMARGFGLDAVRLETGLDALARTGLLVDQAGDAFAFAHALMREALLQTVAARPDAADLHARVAQAKTSWHGADPGPAAAEIARHHLAAGQVERAVEFLLLAAADARASFQYDAAQSFYTEADRWLTESGDDGGTARADVFLGLAEVALEQDIERARRLAQQIERWARQANDQRRLAAALRVQGEALVAAGKAADAERVLQEAEQLCLGGGDAHGAGKVGLARGRAALQNGAAEAARHHFFGAAAHFRSAGDASGEAACKRALGELALRADDRATATRLLSEAADTAAQTNDQHLLAQAAWRLGELLRQSGQLEDAEHRYQQAVDAYDAVGNISGVGRALRGLGDTQRILQRPEAARTYRRAVGLFDEMEDLFQLGICYTQLGRLATDTDDLAIAETAFERALRCLEQFDDPVRLGVLYAFLARIAQRRGDTAARDHRLGAALQIDAQRPLIVSEWPMVLEEAAEGLAAEHESGRAKDLLERATEVWTALRQPERAERARRWAAGLPA